MECYHNPDFDTPDWTVTRKFREIRFQEQKVPGQNSRKGKFQEWKIPELYIPGKIFFE